MRKVAKDLEAGCQELASLYKAVQREQAAKLDTLDRSLFEKGNFTLQTLAKMTVKQKAIELLKIAGREEEDDDA